MVLRTCQWLLVTTKKFLTVTNVMSRTIRVTYTKNDTFAEATRGVATALSAPV